MQEILSFHNTPIANDFHFENSNNNEPELAINRINILVGANNAGKSRFMREIMKLPYLFNENLLNVINSIRLNAEKVEKILSGKIFYEIVDNNSKKSIIVDNYFIKKYITDLNKLLNYDLLALKNYNTNTITLNIIVNPQNDKYTVYEQDKREKHYFLEDGPPQNYNFSVVTNIIKSITQIQLDITEMSAKTYIPTLRSAVTFINENKEVFEINTDEKNKNLFQSSVKHNYELPDDLDIFTGRDLYDTILASKNSDEDVRKEFKKFEKFIGETFFGKTIEITSIYSDKHDKRHIKVAFEGEQERELHNYGDGIQTLMLLTYKLFMAEKGDWIFIEEPELNLHPALQREFLRLITENEDIKAKELRIFFTTHSNHLLDLTITENKYTDNKDKDSSNISIFVFEREKEISEVKSKSKIREVKSGDLQILQQLGVHNSSVFLANCSIWVEGITDRMYVKAYLQAYLDHIEEERVKKGEKEPKLNWKEDRHYSFFEYAGSNIVHYDFDNEEESELINAKFLAKNVMLIADADMGKEAKHDKFKEQLKEKYIKLTVREIENLLSAKQLKSALPNLYTIANDINSEKFKIVEFDEKAYQKIDDKYLRNHVVETLAKYELEVPKGLRLEPKKKGEEVYKTFSSDHKEKLATAVVNDIKNKNITWEHLSKKAQNFTEKIYDFIAEKNKGVIN
jgi:predicted ATPase